MILKARFNVVLFLLIVVIFRCPGYAQHDSQEKYPRGAQYFLGTGDELLIKVNIWGFVMKPGQYLVPSETDLISLISYAGGPAKGAKLSSIKIVHKNETDDDESIEKINVNDYLKSGDESMVPRLKPGDTVVISGSKWHYINSFVEFTTKVVMLVQVYSWIMYYHDLR